MTSNIDYRKTNFEYAELTTIPGRPNYKLLAKVKKELCTNAQTVQCNLGGGAHGHLGLVLEPAEYLLVSPVPYVRPVHPGPLVIPPGPPAVPAYCRQELRDDHKEAVRIFQEAENVETTMKKQLAAAIPDMYIKRFRDNLTNAFNTPLSAMLTTLFHTYGRISAEELKAKEEIRKGAIDIYFEVI